MDLLGRGKKHIDEDGREEGEDRVAVGSVGDRKETSDEVVNDGEAEVTYMGGDEWAGRELLTLALIKSDGVRGRQGGHSCFWYDRQQGGQPGRRGVKRASVADGGG